MWVRVPPIAPFEMKTKQVDLEIVDDNEQETCTKVVAFYWHPKLKSFVIETDTGFDIIPFAEMMK